MIAVVLVLVAYVGATAGVVLHHRRHLDRGVWWQGKRIGPYCGLALGSVFPLAVLVRWWPSMPWPIVMSPVFVTVGLIIAALIGLYRSERDEVNRNRALGEPIHRYLKSENGIVAAVGIFVGFLLIFIAGSTAGDPSPSSDTIAFTLLGAALAVFLCTFVLHTYRRARRHHEIVVMAHRRLATHPPRGPAPAAG